MNCNITKQVEPLIAVYRGNTIESVHRGALAFVSSNGKITASAGNPGIVCFLRSSAKPFQAVPFIESGAFQKYKITLSELAVMTASHTGTKMHTEIIKNILKKTGISQSALKCGAHYPFDEKTRKKLIKDGKKPSVLHSNCSGKHTAMLILCKYYGFPMRNYYELSHPVQQLVIKVLAELGEISINKIKTAVDGCGIPTFALPLYNIALMYAKMADLSSLNQKKKLSLMIIRDAISRYPMLVSEANGMNAVLIKKTKGNIIPKGGACGMYSAAVLNQKSGFAIKMESGEDGIYKCAATVEALKQSGALKNPNLDSLKKYHYPPLKNIKNEKVGFIKYLFKLNSKK